MKKKSMMNTLHNEHDSIIPNCCVVHGNILFRRLNEHKKLSPENLAHFQLHYTIVFHVLTSIEGFFRCRFSATIQPRIPMANQQNKVSVLLASS